jgi:hypothetical protein
MVLSQVANLARQAEIVQLDGRNIDRQKERLR